MYSKHLSKKRGGDYSKRRKGLRNINIYKSFLVDLSRFPNSRMNLLLDSDSPILIVREPRFFRLVFVNPGYQANHSFRVQSIGRQ